VADKAGGRPSLVAVRSAPVVPSLQGMLLQGLRHAKKQD